MSEERMDNAGYSPTVSEDHPQSKRKASDEVDGSSGSKKPKHLISSGPKGTYEVEGIRDVLFTGFSKKDLQKVGLVPCFAVSSSQVGRLREPANKFVLEDLKAVLDRVIRTTLQCKRRTIILADVETVLASLPHPTGLPPLPANVSEWKGDYRHDRSCLRTQLFQSDLRAMVAAVVNIFRDEEDGKFRKLIEKVQPKKAHNSLFVQGSAARVLLNYLELRLIWFYRDAYLAAGYVGVEGDGDSGGSGDGGGEKDTGYGFVIDRRGSGGFHKNQPVRAGERGGGEGGERGGHQEQEKKPEGEQETNEKEQQEDTTEEPLQEEEINE